MSNFFSRLTRSITALGLLCTGLHTAAHAQAPDMAGCQTQVTPEQMLHLQQTAEARSNFDMSGMRTGIIWIPVKLHIIRTSAGTGGITDADASARMSGMNSVYRGLNIQFYECGSRDYIHSDTYYTFGEGEEDALGAAYDVVNVLNIYLYGSGPNYTHLPPGPDRILMTAGAAVNTWVHEAGHYFNLLHTHGSYNSGTGTTELVNGSNCTIAGDLICDTPADPNLSGRVNGACQYTGTLVDANGQPYTPDTQNWMAYTLGGCRSRFSAIQRNWITYSAIYDRSYLSCGSSSFCANTVEVFPHTQSWENTLDTWTQNTDDNFDWTVRTGGTPTTQSGPDAAAAGAYYLYIEATGNTGNKWATITSPCFDLHQVVRPQITFKFNAYGTNADSLVMDVSHDGYTWVRKYSRFGNIGNATWQTATVDISDQFMSGTVRVRFRARTALSGDKGDIALDDFRIQSAPCAGSAVTVSKTDHTCMVNPNGAAAVTVTGSAAPFTYLWNTGASTASLSNLTAGLYTCTVTDAAACTTRVAAVVEQLTPDASAVATGASGFGTPDGALNLSRIHPNGPATYLWSTGATTEDISGLVSGQYTVTITEGSCATPFTFGVPYANRCLGGVVNTYPYTESFETGLGMWYDNRANDQFDVTRTDAPTPTANTGPDAAYNGSWYVYAAAAPNLYLKECWLESPCFDFTGLSQPNLSFAYHKSGSQSGIFEVYAENASGVRTRLGGVPEGLSQPDWDAVSVPLNYAGQNNVKILFRMTTYTGAEGDIALDDILVRDCGGTTLTTSGVDPTCLGSNGQATVNITGSNTPYAITWSTGGTTPTITGLNSGTYTVYVTGGNGCMYTAQTILAPYVTLSTSATTVAESAPGAADGDADLTVAGGRTPYTYLWSNGATTQDLVNVAGGTYTVTVTDAVACTATRTVTISTNAGCTPNVSTFPYSESFETGFGIWSQPTADNFNWTRSNTATPTNSTGPDAAAQGSYYLFTEATGNVPSKSAWLESQCFNLSGYATASFSFKYHLYGNNIGNLTLKYSTNQGTSWTPVWGPTTGNTNVWQTATVSLPVNQYVMLRFEGLTGAGTGDRSDIGLDQFSLTVSTARTVAVDAPAGHALFSQFTLFPNPGTGTVNLNFEAAHDMALGLKVWDLAGKQHVFRTLDVQEGMNLHSFDWHSLPAGVYFLELTEGSRREVHKFVITGQ